MSWRGTVSNDQRGMFDSISCKLLSHLEHHCKCFSSCQWQVRNILFQVLCDGYLMPSEHRVDVVRPAVSFHIFSSASGSSEAPHPLFPLIPDFPVLTMHSFRGAGAPSGTDGLWHQGTPPVQETQFTLTSTSKGSQVVTPHVPQMPHPRPDLPYPRSEQRVGIPLGLKSARAGFSEMRF